MIKVKRLPTPDVLKGPTSKGGRERIKWEEYFAGRRTKRPDVIAYKDDPVVLTLNKMFSYKCAYCETSVAGIDVEHWRPKNAIIRSDGTRLEHGYWWLSADWNNLLLSCTSCNQRRKREVFGEEGLVTAGKGALFPIINNITVKNPGDEKKEKPLLLDPTKNDPEKYLTCVTDPGLKNTGVFRPIGKKSWSNRKKAKTTIKLLGLNSVVYVNRRLDKMLKICSCIHRVARITKEFNDLEPGEERDLVKDEMIRENKELKSYLAPGAEDLLLARQLILPFIERISN